MIEAAICFNAMHTNKPLPRTALEPVCAALANVIPQRRAASGLSLAAEAENKLQ
jgi:hypothetical protein